jgi:hypothetical protein
MWLNRFSWLVWAVCAGAAAPIWAQSGTAPRVVLVELFTSEGCSSCPPADALLRRLNGTRNDQGQLIVGLSEHVTYWNQLGWVDPFSDEAYTARQNGYGGRFRLDEVYTPQVVVNGEAQVLGSDGGAILKAVTKLGPQTPVVVHIDSVADSEAGPKKTLTVTFSVAGLTANGADVYAVIADDMAQSSVQRGENSGRTLSHVSVARSFNKVATLKDAKTVTVSLAVPGVVKGQPETKRHLILFAQEKGQGRVLAVESKAL